MAEPEPIGWSGLAAGDRRGAAGRTGNLRPESGWTGGSRTQRFGARVTGTLGGTCVNIGCVPSKTLIRAAESVHQAGAAARFAGIRAEGRVTDWAALAAQKDELVAGLRQAKYADLLPAHNSIAYLEGPARLTPMTASSSTAP